MTDATWEDGLVEDLDEPLVRLLRWTGPWPDDDPDANLKADVAAYTAADPLATVRRLAASTGIPVGALVRYVLTRWVTGGSEGLLELGPSTVERLRSVVDDAERVGSDAARLAAYDVLRQLVAWLATGLDDPTGTYPDGGAGPRRWLRVAAYGVARDADRLLLVRIRDGFPSAGAWTLPGGGVEHGESTHDALHRELLEETGLPATRGRVLDVDSRHYLDDREDLHALRVVYEVTVPTDRQPQVTEVNGSTDAVRWVHRDELPRLELVDLARVGAELAGLLPRQE